MILKGHLILSDHRWSLHATCTTNRSKWVFNNYKGGNFSRWQKKSKTPLKANSFCPPPIGSNNVLWPFTIFARIPHRKIGQKSSFWKAKVFTTPLVLKFVCASNHNCCQPQKHPNSSSIHIRTSGFWIFDWTSPDLETIFVHEVLWFLVSKHSQSSWLRMTQRLKQPSHHSNIST